MLTARPPHAHSGGLDIHGCHHDRINGGYHCHRGLLAGKSFESRQEMLAAQEALNQEPNDHPEWVLLTHLRRHLKRIRYCRPRFNERIGANLVPKHPDIP
jgi:hypothetical protein